MTNATVPPSAGSAILRSAEKIVIKQSQVPTTPFLDPGVFGWSMELESGWREIRVELDSLLLDYAILPNFQDAVDHQDRITNDDRWKAVFLYGFGIPAAGSYEWCPATMALLGRVPDLVTAFFSVLGPRKRIPPHRGPYRGLLRYHLGLIVPEDREDAGIDVGGEVAHWTEGRSLLFDDGFEHSAWNDTDDLRAVLFLDVKRPLDRTGRVLNEILLRTMAVTPYVRRAKARQAVWASEYRQRRDE